MEDQMATGGLKSGLCSDSSSYFLLSVQEQAVSPNAEIHILKKSRKRKVRVACRLSPGEKAETSRGKRTGHRVTWPVQTLISYLQPFHVAYPLNALQGI